MFRRLADWWSFQMGTVEGWIDPRPEPPVDRAIRKEGERLRRTFPEFYAHERRQRTVVYIVAALALAFGVVAFVGQWFLAG